MTHRCHSRRPYEIFSQRFGQRTVCSGIRLRVTVIVNCRESFETYLATVFGRKSSLLPESWLAASVLRAADWRELS